MKQLKHNTRNIYYKLEQYYKRRYMLDKDIMDKWLKHLKLIPKWMMVNDKTVN